MALPVAPPEIKNGIFCDSKVKDPNGATSDGVSFVSFTHLEMKTDDNSFYITDRSSNGTELNGEKLTKGVAVPIKHGDTVRFGSWKSKLPKTFYLFGLNYYLLMT